MRGISWDVLRLGQSVPAIQRWWRNDRNSALVSCHLATIAGLPAPPALPAPGGAAIPAEGRRSVPAPLLREFRAPAGFDRPRAEDRKPNTDFDPEHGNARVAEILRPRPGPSADTGTPSRVQGDRPTRVSGPRHPTYFGSAAAHQAEGDTGRRVALPCRGTISGKVPIDRLRHPCCRE